jgi:hypothetical protein
MFFCIGQPEVLKDIAAASFVTLAVHVIISFAIRSASRSRCLTSSISRRGVPRPVFDFF